MDQPLTQIASALQALVNHGLVPKQAATEDNVIYVEWINVPILTIKYSFHLAITFECSSREGRWKDTQFFDQSSTTLAVGANALPWGLDETDLKVSFDRSYCPNGEPYKGNKCSTLPADKSPNEIRKNIASNVIYECEVRISNAYAGRGIVTSGFSTTWDGETKVDETNYGRFLQLTIKYKNKSWNAVLRQEGQFDFVPTLKRKNFGCLWLLLVVAVLFILAVSQNDAELQAENLLPLDSQVDVSEMESKIETTSDELIETKDLEEAPLIKTPPTYPERCIQSAKDRETVLIEFDVDENGAVKDARILESSNSCFNRAALNAVAKWQYRPKTENGVAVNRTGVQVTFVFELTDEPPS